jgi:hypothetical protein
MNKIDWKYVTSNIRHVCVVLIFHIVVFRFLLISLLLSFYHVWKTHETSISTNLVKYSIYLFDDDD